MVDGFNLDRLEPTFQSCNDLKAFTDKAIREGRITDIKLEITS